MKFNIYKNNVIYGGGPVVPDWNLAHQNVSADYVLGFFQNIQIRSTSDLRTKEDSMGCYVQFKVKVSDLGKSS